ncbi:bdf1 transcription factor [Diaporthe eres]|uniref:Bromo domain-containing protein n=1 Tax=Diaporthe vaccinii TaxID=105482 RepID=A0ABR4EP35_9PEZI|nr:bdf1 transcription factor [Diaporthe eres]
MARSSSVRRKKGHLSQGPTKGPDVADGAVPGATGRHLSLSNVPSHLIDAAHMRYFTVSDEPIAPPGTTSTRRRSLRIGRRSAAASPVVTLENQRKVKKRQQSRDWKKKHRFKYCSLTIDELLSDKYANCNVHFLKPADDFEIKLPHYLSIVKFPMYLSTIKEAIEAGEYKDSHTKCKKDFMMIVDAAMLFNDPTTDVHKAADKLKRAFMVVLKEIKSKKRSEEAAVVENEDQQETKRSKKGLKRLPSLR